MKYIANVKGLCKLEMMICFDKHEYKAIVPDQEYEVILHDAEKYTIEDVNRLKRLREDIIENLEGFRPKATVSFKTV